MQQSKTRASGGADCERIPFFRSLLLITCSESAPRFHERALRSTEASVNCVIQECLTGYELCMLVPMLMRC